MESVPRVSQRSQLMFWRVLLISTFFVSCTTKKVWNHGFPPIGTNLSLHEKKAAYNRFKVKKTIPSEAVVVFDEIVNGEPDEVWYTHESFSPIFRHATPGIEERFVKINQDFAVWEQLFQWTLISGGAYIDGLTAPIWVISSLRYLFFGSALVGIYAATSKQKKEKETVDEYNDALKIRLGLKSIPRSSWKHNSKHNVKRNR